MLEFCGNLAGIVEFLKRQSSPRTGPICQFWDIFRSVVAKPVFLPANTPVTTLPRVAACSRRLLLAAAAGRSRGPQGRAGALVGALAAASVAAGMRWPCLGSYRITVEI